MPKISVIIPAYNAMTYLPDTLESVFRQTFTDFEVLIINDGSTDNIVQWANQLVDSRVKLISQQHQHVSAARNTGIVHAEGEYIAFLDADDLWQPTKLEKQLCCFQNNSLLGLVYTWTLFIDDLGTPTGILIASHAEGNVWEEILVKDMISNGSSAMVRRTCFEEVGLFDTQLITAEDREMWTRIAARYPFGVVKEPLTLYRRHSQSLSSNKKNMLLGLGMAIEKSFQAVPLDLLYLRNQTYSWMNIFATWAAIENEINYQELIHYSQQAVLHYPQIRFTSQYLRLILAIWIIRSFGYQGYQQFRKLIRMGRENR